MTKKTYKKKKKIILPFDSRAMVFMFFTFQEELDIVTKLSIKDREQLLITGKLIKDKHLKVSFE